MPNTEAALAESQIPTEVQKRNAQNVQIDAVGIGIANAASPFLSVFLTRLGASNTQVGLLTTMPGITGLLTAFMIGHFLQTRRNIVPWFSVARLLVISCYALTGLVTLWLAPQWAVLAILAVWALATIPQTALNVSFSVVMNAIAGPHGRYELMSRRWSILGVTTAISATLAGQLLDRLHFPLNYQVVFGLLSVGGLISYYYSSRIVLPENPAPTKSPPGSGWLTRLRSLRQEINDAVQLVLSEKAFVDFALKRFVYMFGITLAIPIFPLYYVRTVQASDAWIGFINTAQTGVLLVGYTFWTRQSRLRGTRFVLLWATLGSALYPALAGLTQRVELLALYAGIAGIFAAGIDLVFFDELMKTVPPRYSATFVAAAQTMQYTSAIVAPLAGTWLADGIGLGGVLLVSAGVRLLGFLLFALLPAVKSPSGPDAV